MSAEENSLETFDGFIPTSTALTMSWSLFAVAFAFSITTCVLCCCACCSRQRPTLPAVPTTTTRPNRTTGGIQSKHFVLALAALVLVFASIMAGSFATARRVLEKQDYKGLMRITGWSYSDTYSHSEQGHNERRVYKHYIQAHLDLDWGYGWACPNHGNKACSSTGLDSVSECEMLICESRREFSGCSDEEVEAAKLQVQECANNVFDPSLADSGYYVPYDKNEGPSTDENWPNVQAYGDCSDCTARRNAPRPDALKGLRISVIVFLVVAFVVVGGASVFWVRETKRLKDELASSPALPISEVPYGGTAANIPEQQPVVNSYLGSGARYAVGVPIAGSLNTAGVNHPYIVNSNSATIPVVNGVLAQPVKAASSPPIVYAEPLSKSM